MPTTWGARIPARSICAKWAAQTVKGTAVTPANAVNGHFSVTSQAGTEAIFVPGTVTPILFKPGESTVPYELTIPRVPNIDFLANVSRTGGELPWFTLGVGVRFDATGTPTQWAWQVQDCKVHRARLHLSARGYLDATISGEGGQITELASYAIVLETTDYPFMGYEAVLTRGGAAFEVIDWTEDIDHNVSVDHVIAGATVANFVRGWTYQTEGNEAISGSFTLLQKTGINLQAATVATFASVLTLTSKQDAANKQIHTYTNMIFPEERFEGREDGAIFTVPYLAQSRVISAS